MARHHFIFIGHGIISTFLIVMILRESSSSLRKLLPSVDNLPHQQTLLGGLRLPSTRSDRFPSIDKRVKLYMSNWYVPPCPGKSIRFHRLNATSLAIQESKSTVQAANKMRSRILVIRSEMARERIFFLDHTTLWKCVHDPKCGMQTYCQDAKSTLVPALDRVGIGKDGWVPTFLQFGDSIESRRYGYVNLPQIKKARSAATKGSLAKVTHKQCYNLTRDPLVTYHSKSKLQPIIWKLRTERHYSMLPHVAGNDTEWSLKENKAVFRGAFTEPSGNCMLSKRCRFVSQYENSTLVDAQFSGNRYYLPGKGLTGHELTMEQQLKCKAIVVVEGNDVATALKWALLSNSVVMMQPPSQTSWAMEELLEPWVHYIPLNEDLSDVEEKMQWVLDNDDEAQLISKRGSLWIYDLVLHPDSADDDQRIQEKIIRRYRAHFVAAEVSVAPVGSSSKRKSSKNFVKK